MFYIDFGGFLNNPLYFGSNPVGHESMFSRIFQFKKPSKRQIKLIIFVTSFFSRKQRLSDKEVNEEHHEAGKR
jgi:hypothetical protein